MKSLRYPTLRDDITIPYTNFEVPWCSFCDSLGHFSKYCFTFYFTWLVYSISRTKLTMKMRDPIFYCCQQQVCTEYHLNVHSSPYKSWGFPQFSYILKKTIASCYNYVSFWVVQYSQVIIQQKQPFNTRFAGIK